MTVEYSDDGGAPGTEILGELVSTSRRRPQPGGADIPYSNIGTSVRPGFQGYNFDLPMPRRTTSTCRSASRSTRATATYQGFRGLGIDDLSLSTTARAVTENFDNGVPSGWTFDGPSGPGGPFWQVLQIPQNVRIKSPEINPTLVTLGGADDGALPPADVRQRHRLVREHGHWHVLRARFRLDRPGARHDHHATGRRTAPRARTPPSRSPPPSRPPSSSARSTATSRHAPHRSSTRPSRTGPTRSRCGRTTSPATPIPRRPAYAGPSAPATLEDLPDPQQGVSVNVQEVAGTVLVGIPSERGGRARAAGPARRASLRPAQRGQADPGRLVPRHAQGHGRPAERGEPRRASARRASSRAACSRCASRRSVARGLTDLILKGGKFRGAGRAGRGKGRERVAEPRGGSGACASNAQGRFRTSGRNSSATVRGTIWDVTDRCDGTLTHVKRGTVIVRDFRRKKNVTVTTGKSYLAKAPRLRRARARRRPRCDHGARTAFSPPAAACPSPRTQARIAAMLNLGDAVCDATTPAGRVHVAGRGRAGGDDRRRATDDARRRARGATHPGRWRGDPDHLEHPINGRPRPSRPSRKSRARAAATGCSTSRRERTWCSTTSPSAAARRTPGTTTSAGTSAARAR